MLYPVEKQTYKLELPARWKIYDMFHVLLLEQETIRKEWEFLVPEYKLEDDKEYKVEAIRDSTLYVKKTNRVLLELYYLVVWKEYLEEENTWKPSLAVMQLRKMISTFYKDHLKKLLVTLTPLDSTPPMAKPTIQLPTKWKQGQPAKKRATKCVK